MQNGLLFSNNSTRYKLVMKKNFQKTKKNWGKNQSII
jgi:hypothetical protein